MELNDFQKSAMQTAIYPGKGTMDGLMYVVLGLVGEAGEVANKCKKILRDHEGALTSETRLALMAELGDVGWYFAACASELGFSLSEVANRNLDKLAKRAQEGKITGSGDNR